METKNKKDVRLAKHTFTTDKEGKITGTEMEFIDSEKSTLNQENSNETFVRHQKKISKQSDKNQDKISVKSGKNQSEITETLQRNYKTLSKHLIKNQKDESKINAQLTEIEMKLNEGIRNNDLMTVFSIMKSLKTKVKKQKRMKQNRQHLPDSMKPEEIIAKHKELCKKLYSDKFLKSIGLPSYYKIKSIPNVLWKELEISNTLVADLLVAMRTVRLKKIQMYKKFAVIISSFIFILFCATIFYRNTETIINPQSFAVCVGSYNDSTKAIKKAKNFVGANIYRTGDKYRIVVHPTPDKTEAIKKAGELNGWVLKIEN